ncbi:MAG: hypothetical protein IPN87_08255 [Saprospiraceae bacterium]|nr:hypothetical protein [Candidatus Brachybacter algidus]
MILFSLYFFIEVPLLENTIAIAYSMGAYDLEFMRVIFHFFTVLFIIANFIMLVKQRNKSYQANILPININLFLPIIEGMSIKSIARRTSKDIDSYETYPVKFKFDNIGQGVARDITIRESYPFNFREVIDYLFGQLSSLGYHHKYIINDNTFKFEEDENNFLYNQNHILFKKSKDHSFDYQLTVKDSEDSLKVPANKAFLFMIVISLYLFARIRDKRKEFGFSDRKYYNLEKEVWGQVRKMVRVNFTINFVDNLERHHKSAFTMQLSALPIMKDVNGISWANVQVERRKK